MPESQSDKSLGKSSLQAEQASVAFQFDPKRGLMTGSATGSGPTIYVVGILGLLGAVVYKWDALGWLAPALTVSAFVLFAVVIRWSLVPHSRVHVTKNTLTFQGITQEALLRGGLLHILIEWVSQRRPIGLPEPDARVDAKSGKHVPFKPGEKEKVLEEQKTIEAEVAKELAEMKATEAITLTATVGEGTPKVD